MDGQHRLEVMKALKQAHQVDVSFQFRVKVVATDAEAYAELMLYQVIKCTRLMTPACASCAERTGKCIGEMPVTRHW